MLEKDINILMKRLSSLGEGELGKGPRHPEEPNMSILPTVERFLKENSFLQKDKHYIQFLETYAGAGIQGENEEFVIDLFGFTDVSTNFYEQDEHSIVDEDGFLTFCGGYASLDSNNPIDFMIPQGFLFDATGERKWGIYRGSNEGHYWYCETFVEWLNDLIHHGGKIPLDVSN